MAADQLRDGEPGRPASVLNLSGQQLTRLEKLDGSSVTTLILDNNCLGRIESLDHGERLRQLSMANNQIARMAAVSQLSNLTVLNLPNNQITAIEGTRNLLSLTWLNLSGNLIRAMDQLERNVNLKHLDLSDNHVSAIANIANLKSLKTLLLHGNRISSLRMASQCLPASITILSLAENLIDDLTEVSFLTSLAKLEQLSIMNNPCVVAPSEDLDFDYRPYVINWCLRLRLLDGRLVTEKESLRAEWLYSQGKGRHFKPGQHAGLVLYLSHHCPLPSIRQDPQDEKLALILSKQRYHQSQLQRTAPGAALRPHTSPERRTVVPSPGHGPGSASLYAARDDNDDEEEEPVRGWAGAESGSMSSELAPPPASVAAAVASARSPRSNRLGARFPGPGSGSGPGGPSARTVVPPLGQDDVKENVRPRHGRSGAAAELSPRGPTAPREPTRSPARVSRSPPRVSRSPPPRVSPRSPPPPRMPVPALSGGPHFAPPRGSSSLGPSSMLHRAAARIQAVWRGYRTRSLHPRVRRFRAEQDRARVREHVAFLQEQLDGYYAAYAQERQLRELQTSAIKGLMQEVSELKSWRARLEAAPAAPPPPPPPPMVSQTAPGATLADLPSLASALGASLAGLGSGGAEGVDRACGALESQVSDLSRSLSELRATLRMARDRSAATALASVPHVGCPLPPRGLRVSQRGPGWLEVAWRPSLVVRAGGATCAEGVVGYRVLVDGRERAMVFDSKTAALLPGLDLSRPMSVSVRCVSEVGESFPSERLDVLPEVADEERAAEAEEEEVRGTSRQSALSADEDPSEVADRERVYAEARKVMEMSTSYESERSQATVTEARLSTNDSVSERSPLDGGDGLEASDEDVASPRKASEREEEEKERDETEETP